MFRLELFLFARKIDLDPQPLDWESQYFSIKDPVLFFQNGSFFISTRSCSYRLQSKNSRAPLQARAGKLFCSGVTGASVGEYRGSNGSHETTKTPEAWAA